MTMAISFSLGAHLCLLWGDWSDKGNIFINCSSQASLVEMSPGVTQVFLLVKQTSTLNVKHGLKPFPGQQTNQPHRLAPGLSPGLNDTAGSSES